MFETDTVTCIECGASLGANKSIYAHTLGCLNVQDKGIDQVMHAYGGRTDENAQRVMRMMRLARERGE